MNLNRLQDKMEKLRPGATDVKGEHLGQAGADVHPPRRGLRVPSEHVSVRVYSCLELPAA